MQWFFDAPVVPFASPFAGIATAIGGGYLLLVTADSAAAVMAVRYGRIIACRGLGIVKLGHRAFSRVAEGERRLFRPQSVQRENREKWVKLFFDIRRNHQTGNLLEIGFKQLQLVAVPSETHFLDRPTKAVRRRTW